MEKEKAKFNKKEHKKCIIHLSNFFKLRLAHAIFLKIIRNSEQSTRMINAKRQLNTSTTWLYQEIWEIYSRPVIVAMETLCNNLSRHKLWPREHRWKMYTFRYNSRSNYKVCLRFSIWMTCILCIRDFLIRFNYMYNELCDL